MWVESKTVSGNNSQQFCPNSVGLCDPTDLQGLVVEIYYTTSFSSFPLLSDPLFRKLTVTETTTSVHTNGFTKMFTRFHEVSSVCFGSVPIRSIFWEVVLLLLREDRLLRDTGEELRVSGVSFHKFVYV